jgi:serine/threonine-protein kinase
MTSQPPDSDPIERLRAALADRYEILDQVGQGGMATVYLARDIKHERNVALKVLRPELSASLGAERFLREIRVAANLQHPNILALYDSGDADGALYYVMPFVEGESLRDRLDRETQLSIPDALKIIREVSEALSYAHSQGVIHRDIKPENIMLMGDHALVADFGIARAVEEAGEDKLTQSGMAIGTPLYMSPEQATGVERLDGRSDIYSLGCMLYELLTGEPPFQGATPIALMAKHSMEAIPSGKVLRNTIPDEVDAAIGKAMAKVPADRFQTALQLAEALGSVEHRLSMGIAVPVTAPVPAHPAPAEQRRPSAMLLAAGGGLALVVGAIAAWQLGLFGGGDAGFAAETGPSPKNIAVLYFEDRSPDQSLGYLADGFTEALIGELSTVQGLKVISRNGVRQFQGQRVSPDSVSRALDVGTVVEGTVEQLGDQLRINVSLVNAVDGSEIGSTRLERTRAETFTLQDEVSRDVSAFLRTRLGEEIQLRESRRGTRNVAAWEKVQEAVSVEQGVHRFLGVGDLEGAAEEFSRADSIFAEAAELDDKWASPVASRGWIAYRRARELAQGFDKAHYAEWIENGMVHAERAVELDPEHPDALELRGTLQYFAYLLNLEPEGEKASQLLARAEQDFRASIAANPLQASALTSLSHLLMNRSKTAQAKVAAQQAYDADPYLSNAHLTIWRLFTSSLDLDDAVEAKRWCGEGQRRFSSDPRFVECQIRIPAMRGETPDVPELWRLVDQYVELWPENVREFRSRRAGMFVAMALVRARLPDSARAVAVRSRGNATVDQARELAYFEAIVRTFLGDMDEAIEQLSIFLAANPNQRATFATDDLWWFEDLRADPRWKALVGSN